MRKRIRSGVLLRPHGCVKTEFVKAQLGGLQVASYVVYPTQEIACDPLLLLLSRSIIFFMAWGTALRLGETGAL